MSITKEYLVLFNAIEDAEQALQSLQLKLIAAQQLAEEIYISRNSSETNISLQSLQI